MKKRILLVLFVLLSVFFIFAVSGCKNADESGKQSGSKKRKTETAASLTIISGSENKALEPMIHEFAGKHGADISITYSGSIDMMLALSEQGAKIPYDAVCPANSLWLSLGDDHKVVKYSESIMRSPVALGIRKSIAERLGWVGKPVAVSDILSAAEAGILHSRPICWL